MLTTPLYQVAGIFNQRVCCSQHIGEVTPKIIHFITQKYQNNNLGNVCTGTPRCEDRSCGGVIWFLSFVTGAYSLYRVATKVVKWKCGKEKPFVKGRPL